MGTEVLVEDVVVERAAMSAALSRAEATLENYVIVARARSSGQTTALGRLKLTEAGHAANRNELDCGRCLWSKRRETLMASIVYMEETRQTKIISGRMGNANLRPPSVIPRARKTRLRKTILRKIIGLIIEGPHFLRNWTFSCVL